MSASLIRHAGKAPAVVGMRARTDLRTQPFSACAGDVDTGPALRDTLLVYDGRLLLVQMTTPGFPCRHRTEAQVFLIRRHSAHILAPRGSSRRACFVHDFNGLRCLPGIPPVSWACGQHVSCRPKGPR